MKYTTNIYKIARLKVQISQVDAAENLAISRNCLNDYESDVRQVPDDVVANMMHIYKAKYLGYQHLRNNLVGKLILPPINPDKGIAAVAISSHIALDRLVIAINDLLDIAQDDYIDAGEQERFRMLQDAIQEAVSALMAVAVGAFKNKKTANLAKLTVLEATSKFLISQK